MMSSCILDDLEVCGCRGRHKAHNHYKFAQFLSLGGRFLGSVEISGDFLCGGCFTGKMSSLSSSTSPY
jgi:hypothetical protein